MKLRQLVLALALALPVSALAGSCPTLMKKIDEILATNPDVEPEVLAEVKEAREAGAQFHNDGRHDESVAELNHALSLLGE